MSKHTAHKKIMTADFTYFNKLEWFYEGCFFFNLRWAIKKKTN